MELQNSATGSFTLPSLHVSLWFSPEGSILEKNTDTTAAMQLQGPTKQPKLRFLSKWGPYSPEGCILQKNTDCELQGPTKQPKLRFLSK